MQIVIDIDKDIVQGIINGENDTPRSIVRGFQATIASAIKHCTPLPEHHGKLIAEPTKEEIEKTVGGQNDFAESIRASVEAVFYNAPPIIKADKESEGK